MPEDRPSTGIPELDRLMGGVLPGDNIVWETDSGAPADRFVSNFVSASADEGSTLVYVSFNHSPQSIASRYVDTMSPGRLILVDCFSSGKGNNDEMFLEFFKTNAGVEAHGPIHLENPADPANLQAALVELGSDVGMPSRYVFDSLTGMQDLWANEKQVLRFFGHFCPRLFDLNTVAYWLLEKGAHPDHFLARIRHITQVVLEVTMSQGARTLTVRKAAGRSCAQIGVPQRFDVLDGRLVIASETREDRELTLLTALGEALRSALEPNAFFEQIIRVLASELGMIRGTLVLLDTAANKLRIVAAHGLTSAECARGEYAVGEGVTGQVVKTGLPEVVPDIRRDRRFLDRTAARKADLASPIAFICVPVVVDNEVVGALSADRPFAGEAMLEKDLRLLTIVASTISQVLKINRLIRVDKEEILVRDKHLLEELRERYRLDNVVGGSEGIRRCLAVAATAAQSRASILITGETGTGKELIAGVVHYNSPRHAGPFVKVSCAALPETLLESELFGHVKGAFTGAVRDRKGRFELADGGTLFLDEVGEMSPRLQVKLLRVLQEREFEPVGSAHSVRVDVRVVAATAKNLKKEADAGRFCEGLYYRLNVVPICLPPLRERREDIPLLVNHFLEKYNRENDKSVTKLSREVLDLLLKYPWPGNVRELENCIERAVVMNTGDTLSADLLPEEIVSRAPGRVQRARGAGGARLRTTIEEYLQGSGDLADAREELARLVEEMVLRTALESPGVSQRQLAKRLGLSRVTLRKKLRDYGLA